VTRGREAERAYQQISADLRHGPQLSPSLVLFTTRAGLDRGLTSGTLPGRPDSHTRILLSVDGQSVSSSDLTGSRTVSVRHRAVVHPEHGAALDQKGWRSSGGE
jgi:hypothetical protein